MGSLLDKMHRNVDSQNNKLDIIRREISSYIYDNIKKIAEIAGVSKGNIRTEHLDIDENETVILGINKNSGYYMLKVRISKSTNPKLCYIDFVLEISKGDDKEIVLETFKSVKDIENSGAFLKVKLDQAVEQYLSYIIK